MVENLVERKARVISRLKCISKQYNIFVSGICDSSYNNCLEVKLLKNLTWFDARALCKEKGGDILSFQDSSDLVQLRTHLQPQAKYWVGVRKAVWQWNDTIGKQH